MTPCPQPRRALPDGVDEEEYDRPCRRRVMWMMPTGLYLLGTRDGERRNLDDLQLGDTAGDRTGSWSASASRLAR